MKAKVIVAAVWGASLLGAPAVGQQAKPPPLTITAVPTRVIAGRPVHLIPSEQGIRLTKSGGVWCLSRACEWVSERAGLEYPESSAIWKADTPGTYTIRIERLPADETGAGSVKITVRDPIVTK